MQRIDRWAARTGSPPSRGRAALSLMRGRSAPRHLPGNLALFRIFAAPVVAEGDRPGADTVFAPGRRKTPAVTDRLVGVPVRAFSGVKIPPPAAGADEFGGHGHRAHSLSIRPRIEPLFVSCPQLSRAGVLLPQRAQVTGVACDRCLPREVVAGGCTHHALLTMFRARLKRCAPGSGTAVRGRSGDRWRA